jgi:hypothetical protein
MVDELVDRDAGLGREGLERGARIGRLGEPDLSGELPVLGRNGHRAIVTAVAATPG